MLLAPPRAPPLSQAPAGTHASPPLSQAWHWLKCRKLVLYIHLDRRVVGQAYPWGPTIVRRPDANSSVGSARVTGSPYQPLHVASVVSGCESASQLLRNYAILREALPLHEALCWRELGRGPHTDTRSWHWGYIHAHGRWTVRLLGKGNARLRQMYQQ